MKAAAAAAAGRLLDSSVASLGQIRKLLTSQTKQPVSMRRNI